MTIRQPLNTTRDRSCSSAPRPIGITHQMPVFPSDLDHHPTRIDHRQRHSPLLRQARFTLTANPRPEPIPATIRNNRCYDE